MPSLRDLIIQLYSELERLSCEHPELTDTDVREVLHLTLNFAFIWGKEMPVLPQNYAMFSPEGDMQVGKAVADFLSRAVPAAESSGLSFGQDRLDALQDRDLSTPGGQQFDTFIGHTDSPLPPEPLWSGYFEPGEYDEEE